MRQFSLFIILSLMIACGDGLKADNFTVSGVSRELAQSRKASITNLRYHLNFFVPDSLSQPLLGVNEIVFSLTEKQDIILDFLGDRESIVSVMVNNDRSEYKIINDHIVIPEKKIVEGDNHIIITYTVSDQSINRREDYLYTLLVPDRARTLFPCFDQPNLKASFHLNMEIPEKWQAIANGKKVSEEICGGRKSLKFNATEPLSTYLFSFVVGRFDCVTESRSGREVSLYHREDNPEKVKQIDEIFNQVFLSLNWLEDYTAIKYPFAKYDLIILPGFQYGGMEHMGATLYSDKRMFLSQNPTIDEELGRYSLIAHETAHMWFGDYVTMDWFNDVWTKEVFANYFAAQMVSEKFKDINHELNFLFSYAPSAYAEDRTRGTNPIQQELDNLNNAGLVYGNIIYNKSPIVMNMLVNVLGKDLFQKGVRTYLNKYAYGNATWDNLIEIFDNLTEKNIQQWSDVWVKEKSMPTIALRVENDTLVVSQDDVYNRDILWEQSFSILVVADSTYTITLNLKDKENRIALGERWKAIIPNSNGRGYGYFKMDKQSLEYALKNISTFDDELTKGSLLITLHENMLNKNVEPQPFLDCMMEYIQTEENSLLFSRAMNYAKSCALLFEINNQLFEDFLWTIFTKNKNSQYQITALRNYSEIVENPEKLYALWSDTSQMKKLKIGENDAMQISWELAIRMPQESDKIVAEQLSRLTNVDSRKEYEYISPAVSPLTECRDSVFNSLFASENRSIEPWTAKVLSLLNHRLHQKDAIKYIYPALEMVYEVQQTGDIFFPTMWCRALLSGHQSKEANEIVEEFFKDNPTYSTMLGNKIKQNSYHLSL